MATYPRPVTPTPAGRCPPISPRKHKSPHKRRTGTRSKPPTPTWTTDGIKKQLEEKLKLSFVPDAWQPFILKRIMERFDSLIVAGTGYGKSLIFEGLAVLGGRDKVVVVICPLKALENDQVESACAKGIDAVTINEDTPDSERKSMWARIRTTAQMVYISPEMALSDGFISLWADKKFRGRLTALVVDEAHCIHEWGTQKFRPEYGLLSRLRTYTGQDIPFVACTATCPTSTFDTLWTSLGYGCRPFWGIDVGCDRPNLFFHTRILENPSNPTLDLLNLLPAELSSTTRLEDINKTLIYIDSEASCRDIRDEVRRLLPEHLRSCVRAFSSDLSEAAKKQIWTDLKSGKIRIVVATDAAGMGCNVDDIRLTVILGCPKSFSVVSQRWGRAGRSCGSLGTCLLLVPSWAFRPKEPLAVPAVAAMRGKKKDGEESKTDTKKRENLPLSLEQFINQGDDACAHQYLREHFRPTTHLTVRNGLDTAISESVGYRARDSPYDLIWTVLDLNRVPPKDRCCGLCNPALAAPLKASDIHDERRFTFSTNFLFPNSTLPPRSVSVASTTSQQSSSSTFKPVSSRYTVQKEEKESLEGALIAWRERRHDVRGSGVMFSSQIALPTKQINTLVENCRRLLQARVVTRDLILSVIRWDSATDVDLEEVCEVVREWREGIHEVTAPPLSQRRASKRPNTGLGPPRPPLGQPNFGGLSSSSQPTGHSLRDVFGTPVNRVQPSVLFSPATPQPPAQPHTLHSAVVPSPEQRRPTFANVVAAMGSPAPSQTRPLPRPLGTSPHTPRQPTLAPLRSSMRPGPSSLRHGTISLQDQNSPNPSTPTYNPTYYRDHTAATPQSSTTRRSYYRER